MMIYCEIWRRIVKSLLTKHDHCCHLLNMWHVICKFRHMICTKFKINMTHHGASKILWDMFILAKKKKIVGHVYVCIRVG
jgi:hypothetical protein